MTTGFRNLSRFRDWILPAAAVAITVSVGVDVGFATGAAPGSSPFPRRAGTVRFGFPGTVGAAGVTTGPFTGVANRSGTMGRLLTQPADRIPREAGRCPVVVPVGVRSFAATRRV